MGCRQRSAGQCVPDYPVNNQESKRVNNICILFSKNYVNDECAKFSGLRAIVGLVSCHRAFVG